MPFSYERTIRLGDTDAAGIVFFANYLALCHEAYESSLAEAGIDMQDFFGGADLIVPISKSTVDYLRPLSCGEEVSISVQPKSVTENTFTIDYELTRLTPPAKIAARAQTTHVCTSRSKRSRAPLPSNIAAWVAQD
jgi:1,4-dihydroxy-2-naphthoyl-CoA hydrolase